MVSGSGNVLLRTLIIRSYQKERVFGSALFLCLHAIDAIANPRNGGFDNTARPAPFHLPLRVVARSETSLAYGCKYASC